MTLFPNFLNKSTTYYEIGRKTLKDYSRNKFDYYLIGQYYYLRFISNRHTHTIIELFA